MKNWILLFTLLLGFVAGEGTTPFSAFAQGPVTKKGIDGAVQNLSSPSPKDWSEAEATLKAAIKNPDQRERATLALAIIHIKRGNQQVIANLIRQKEKLFTSRSVDIEAQLLRFQLWHDLASEQSAEATGHFSQLLELTLHGNPSEASLKANAALLAAVIGMLELPAAQSPIDPNALALAKKRIHESQNDPLSSDPTAF